MRIEEGWRYTYCISGEAWWEPKVEDVIIARDHDEGGGAWEFNVIAHNLGGPSLALEIHGDAWDAFADVPELFEALRTRVPHTFSELVAILDELGFVDVTPREIPEERRNPPPGYR